MAKKPFNETAVGRFLHKAKGVVPGVAVDIGDVFTGGKVSDILDKIGIKLKEAPESQEVIALRTELDLRRIDYEVELVNAQVALYEIDFKDRERASNTEIERLKNGGNGWTQHILAFVIVLGFLAAVFIAMRKGIVDVGPEAALILGTFLGQLSNQATTVIQYFFGSSSGSAAKNRILQQINKP